ncbi:flavin reductase family protein [Salibacterium qingdaonense]|uniref:NADH-FMN oxidoreductase RutF, flavin reductase (DIM6/NTAB) family n=1 Tax=Salibacterium qingdaonense TaxID=266892 RepID=A0A1I4I350_9BACI|nr:flavin reductase family protein [Salibacterium qingdaonense]SFL48858.1 NADH-FMN oxidoreductase RutF, flavin reductase (DIM6/NTAB) family [Salibacterium qingdaonense]
MDDRLFKTAMGKFATGVTVVTTDTEDGVHGMTANAFMSVSMDPKLVLISVGRHANTHRIIEQNGAFAVNILSEDQIESAQYFAKQLEEDVDIPIERFEGQPIIEGSLASIACTVYDSHEAGDHTLFIGQVENLIVQDEMPLLYVEGQFRYFQ